MASDFDQTSKNKPFPPTSRSAIAMVGSTDPAAAARAFERLVYAYWKPVYAYLRVRWRRATQDARDLTQAFFARALERGQLKTFDPARAHFRTYLKGALDHFVLEADRAERREKRGGKLARLSLDLNFDVLEAELGAAGIEQETDVDRRFELEWIRGLFASAVTALEETCRSTGKMAHFRLFSRFVLEPELPADPGGGAHERAGGARPTYAALANDLGLSVTDVTNHLAWARRTFRELVLDELAAITATEEEFKAEARAVLGISL